MTDCRILTGFGFIEFETEKVRPFDVNHIPLKS